MKSFFYILLLLSSLHSFGQNDGNFSKLFDDNNMWQGFSAGAMLENDNYLLSGFNVGPWWSSFFIWNIILDQNGDTISTRKIVSGDSSTYYIGKQSLVRHHQSYYLAGSQAYDSEGLSDGVLIKLDEQGGRIWQKSFGGSNFESIDAMVMNDNHELVLAGVSHSFGDSSWGNTYVLKTDTIGELIWQKSLGINNFPERCWSMDTTTDKGYVLAGIQGFDSQENIFVIKIDSLGNQKWKKTFAGKAYPRIRALKNGDFLLSTVFTQANGSNQAYMTRLSPSGVKLWQKYYPGEEGDSFFGFSAELPDGNLVIEGAVLEFDSIFNTNYWLRGTLTKTDAQGNLIWQRKYYTTPNHDNFFYGMITTPDAGFLLFGSAFRPDNNRVDAWVVKVDSLGCLEPGCAGGVAAPEPGTAAAGLRIYPNPASSWLTVESEEAILLGLRLTDLSGRVIEDVQFFRQEALREHRLSLAWLPAGAYVLSVRTDRGWASERVVKN